MPTFLNIIWAVLLGFMLWRMWPVAKHWMENGPRGTQKEWLNASMLLAAVVLFVVLLMVLVRG